MVNTSIIEVAVGLIFVYYLLAFLVTQINSTVTSVLNLRAKDLKAGLQTLITDKRIQAKLLAHPIINMVPYSVPADAQISEDMVDQIVHSRETRVSHIPPTTFVNALLNILFNESESSMFAPLRNAIAAMPTSNEKSRLRQLLHNLWENFSEDTIRALHREIYLISDMKLRDELYAGLKTIEEAITTLRYKNEMLIPLINSVKSITDPRLRSALLAVFSTVESVDEARERLEAWFNDGMNRISNIFKERIQFFSLVSAFTLAVVLNVDTIFLARSLWENPELRQAVVATATIYEDSQIAAIVAEVTPEAPSTTPDTTTPGLPDIDTDLPPEDQPGLAETLAAIEQDRREVQETVQVLLELQLPIWWEWSSVTPQLVDASLELGLPDPRWNTRNAWNFFPGNNPNWLSLLLEKLIGLAATTIAAAQGAPFWFDLLNRLARGGR